MVISGPEWSESEWVHPEWVHNTAFFVFIILSYQQKTNFHQNYLSHTFKLTCFILRCTVFICMHYSRPYANWSYQSILGLLKPYLETAATSCWWAEERREKGDWSNIRNSVCKQFFAKEQRNCYQSSTAILNLWKQTLIYRYGEGPISCFAHI
jgi:hypothetical protein